MKQPPGRRVMGITQRLTPAVKWLIGVSVAAFVVFVLAGKAAQGTLMAWLVLTPGDVLAGQVWKLATTVLFPSSPFAFLFDMLILWMFMPFLERAWGTRRFLTLGAVAVLTANVISTVAGVVLGGPALGVVVGGITPFIYAALVGYGVDFGDQQIQLFGIIPMKGRTLAIGMAVVVIIATAANGTWVLGIGHMAAMVAAFLMTSGRLTPRLWLLRWRHARLKRRYKVLDGGQSSTKKWIN